jgi:hypothetical protein
MDWDAVRNVTTTALCKLLDIYYWNIFLSPMCTMPIKIWFAGKVKTTNLGLNILGSSGIG